MRYLLLILATLVAVPVAAQQPYSPERLTDADYAHAETFLRSHTTDLVFGASVDAVWLSDGRFWYRNDTPEGAEFIIVDPAARTRTQIFDQPQLAASISELADTTYAANELPIRDIQLLDDDQTVSFQVGNGRFRCDLDTYLCAEADALPPGPGRNVVVSPDGRLGAFTRDDNLWVRNLETGREFQLTTDGQEDFGYATNNAGWTRSDRPVMLWSPDSRSIATFQHDSRGVGMMYLVSTNVGHPELDAWKYPMPGDSVVFRLHRVVIDLDDLDAPRVVRLQMPPDVQRSTVCDHIVCGGGWSDITWTPDASQLVFASVSRGHDTVTLRVADPETGEVRDVYQEVEDTFFNLNYRDQNWRVLAETNEFIWFSQRDDWGHLYLYDLGTGELKHQITQGDWNVLEILRVDQGDRTITFIGNEREPGDPYFEYLYRVSMDGGEPILLTPDSANHRISLSPSGEYFVDTYSTPTTPPVSVVRNSAGDEVLALERADISGLLASGWQPPIPFSVKARDGVTDLYGLMFRPTDFDPSLKYPIINHIYPGPQGGSVGSRSFVPSRGDAQALAELGFIVVELDALGSGPKRSKSFQEFYYGEMGDNGLPDQIDGMRQLAERYPWIDLERVGIYGHSGGGFASTGAILRYPDFFDVAVSQAGNHENRNYEDDWGEQWQGLLEVYPDGSTNYDAAANWQYAKNLEGKLLLAHGTADDNVPPSNTLLVVDALIAANKDFDLIMFPNRTHGFGGSDYMTRRRWDYFVEHLLDATPPDEFDFGG